MQIFCCLCIFNHSSPQCEQTKLASCSLKAVILCVSGVTPYEYPPTAPLHCKHLIWFILKAVNQCAYPPTKWIPTIQKHVRTLKHKDNCFLMISHYANTHHVAINLGGSFYLPDHQLIRHTDVYYMRKVMRQRLLCTTLSIFFNWMK